MLYCATLVLTAVAAMPDGFYPILPWDTPRKMT